MSSLDVGIRTRRIGLLSFLLALCALMAQGAEFSADQYDRWEHPNIDRIQQLAGAAFGQAATKKRITKPEREMMIECYAAGYLTVLYVKGRDTRSEEFGTLAMSSHPGVVHRTKHPDMIRISFPAKRLQWNIRLIDRTYTRGIARDGRNLKRDVLPKLRHVGKEKIQGYWCEKYTGLQADRTENVHTTIWWSPKLDWALKEVTDSLAGRSIIELRNIRERHLPDSLFSLRKI